MEILIAEDDPITTRLLEDTLRRLGHEVISAANGELAWQAMCSADPPKIAVIDWEMPGLSGLELCTRIRGLDAPLPPYLFLLTARTGTKNLVAGLNAGANDYLTKPFNFEELAARIRTAEYVLTLQNRLAERVEELEQALQQIRTLRGLLPVCAWCKRIRRDADYWQKMEEYVSQETGLRFSHGICPECYRTATDNDEPTTS